MSRSVPVPGAAAGVRGARSASVSHTSTCRPFIESDPAAPASDLRAAMAEHGYLFFRRLVPADAVLAVRRAVLEHCAEAGWLDPAHDLLEGVVRPGVAPTTEGRPEYMAVYRKVLRTPLFHDFPAHPALMAVAGALIPGQVLVHPRRIGRMTFPHYTVATTPAHQDHFYIRGAVETYSCWTPLGACPVELGGLAVWRGSHERGFVEHSERIEGAVGGRGVPVEESAAEWHTADFEAGDALFFHAYTIHKALPNLTDDRMRISTDNRYQLAGDAIDPGALRPHFDL
jgi:ectoine hydroxylase-related dioxygenase (phytanoyl-CoA dioxygenase family)